MLIENSVRVTALKMIKIQLNLFFKLLHAYQALEIQLGNDLLILTKNIFQILLLKINY